MSRSPKPGDVIADRYLVERCIGRGGMAEVFAGVNQRTNKRVALKWIRPALAHTSEALARFGREALAAGRIHHPNVVTVFDVVEDQNATWLVMELLEGEPLSEILRRRKFLPISEAASLLLPAMRGVAAAHARGVVHRDIKPENIFICRGTEIHRGEAKVLDFGVSKLSDPNSQEMTITSAGNLVGTPIYMAPELVRGSRDVDQRVDVYALGVVFYEMLAGRTPYQGDVYSALAIAIATTDPPRLRDLRPEVPQDVENLIARAMARDLDWRFPDVPSFIRALEQLMRNSWADTPLGSQDASGGVGLGGDSGRVPRSQVAGIDMTAKIPERRAGRTVLVIAGVFAALAVIVMVFSLVIRRRRASTEEQAASKAAVPGLAVPSSERVRVGTASPAGLPPSPASESTKSPEKLATPAPSLPPPAAASGAPTITQSSPGSGPTGATSAHSRGKASAATRANKSSAARELPEDPGTRRAPAPSQPPNRAGRLSIDDF